MNDFKAVGEFHYKFGLPMSDDGIPQMINAEVRDFRLKFLLEELTELANGYGLELAWSLSANPSSPIQDLPKVADALVDLVYVALGTAHFHRLPWPALFKEVQRANMAKERCGVAHEYEDDGEGHCARLAFPLLGEPCGLPKLRHSARGSALDVIKPNGWRAPRIVETLLANGWPGLTANPTPSLFEEGQ